MTEHYDALETRDPASREADLFARLPEASSVAVDRDPTLLALARGTFDGDPRISFLGTDLMQPAECDAWLAEIRRVMAAAVGV